MGLSGSRNKINMPGVCVKDVSQQAFVMAFAAHLKKSGKLKVPAWVDLIKTGVHKELSPYNPDWYYVRCASTLRQIYGGRKRRGTKPSHFCPSSSSVARKVLQSLEGVKLVQKDELGGRRITSAGQRDLDRIAGQVAAAANA